MFGDDNADKPRLSYIDFTPHTSNDSNPPKTDFDPNDTNEFNTIKNANPTTLTTNKSYHVMTTYDTTTNTHRFYLNNMLTNTRNIDRETIQNLTYTTIRFNSDFFYADPNMNKTIDEMRVYTSVL